MCTAQCTAKANQADGGAERRENGKKLRRRQSAVSGRVAAARCGGVCCVRYAEGKEVYGAVQCVVLLVH